MYSPLAGGTSILRLYCHTLCIFGLLLLSIQFMSLAQCGNALTPLAIQILRDSVYVCVMTVEQYAHTPAS